MTDQIRINGNAHSWGSTKLTVGFESYTGITSITYGDKITRVKGTGMGRSHAATRRSSGKYETDNVKMKGFKSTIESIRRDLALLAADQRSYGTVSVPITLQFVEAFDTPMNIVIKDCKVCADTASAEENPDPLMDEIEFDCMSITRNGKTLFDSTQGLV